MIVLDDHQLTNGVYSYCCNQAVLRYTASTAIHFHNSMCHFIVPFVSSFMLSLSRIWATCSAVSEICLHCRNKDLIKEEKSRGRKQKYQCRSCKKYGTVLNTRFYDEEEQIKLLGRNNERMSLRAISRQFGVSR